jgi:putative membrane protein
MAQRPFCTAEGDVRIRDAIRAAESGTSGEIAVMIVPESDRYREAEILGGFLVGGFAAFVACLAIGHITLWTYIPLTALFFFPWRFLFKKVPRLKLPFLSVRRLSAAVRQRAVRAFLEKELHRTREENGILIFLSLLERRVWILADRGIDARIPHVQWKELAAEVSRGVREGKGCDAVCAAVVRCGGILAEHFPPREDDVNELPDDVLR